MAMSYNSGGPSGPNVPPPPGQGNGGSYGQQVPGAQYGATGHAQPTTGSHPPEKKSKTPMLLGAILGGLLLLALCCGGGWFLSQRGDDESSSSTTSSSSTSSSSTDTSSSSSTDTSSSSSTSSDTSSSSSSTSATAGGTVTLPDEFDGWKKVDTSVSAPAGGQVGAYTKGSEALSIVTMADQAGVMDGFESLWDNEQKVGDASCGKYSGQTQCAKVQDGTIFLITHSGDVKTTAGYLEDFLAAV